MRRSQRQPATSARKSNEEVSTGPSLRTSQAEHTLTAFPMMNGVDERKQDQVELKPTTSLQNGQVPGYAVYEPLSSDSVVEVSHPQGRSEIIDEYSFASEDEPKDDEHEMDDLTSHISLSSTESDHNFTTGLNPRPWMLMNHEQRAIYESQFIKVTIPAIGASWAFTEEYQLHLDNQYAEYVKDFPIDRWALPRELALQADHQFRERQRYRSLGIRIYSSDRTPDYFRLQTSYGPNNSMQIPRPQTSQLPQGQKAQTSRVPPKVSSVHQQIRSVGREAQLRTSPTASVSRKSNSTASALNDRSLSREIQDSQLPPTQLPQRLSSSMVAAHVSSGPVRYPWRRKMEFRAAIDAASWRIDVYTPATLKAMAETRLKNVAVLEDLDNSSGNNQAKEPLISNGAHADGGKSSVSDLDAGAFAFFHPADGIKAKKLGFGTPAEILHAGESDKLNMAQLESIRICWRPRTTSSASNLQQAPFSAKDTVLTRKQLSYTPILTKKAADCIIDFSPDLLREDVLLRICSEAGYDEEDVRIRYSLNGCYAKKSSMARRLAVALGKLTRAEVEDTATANNTYETNRKDFMDYCKLFGEGITALDTLSARKRGLADMETAKPHLDRNENSNHKRTKLDFGHDE